MWWISLCVTPPIHQEGVLVLYKYGTMETPHIEKSQHLVDLSKLGSSRKAVCLLLWTQGARSRLSPVSWHHTLVAQDKGTSRHSQTDESSWLCRWLRLVYLQPALTLFCQTAPANPRGKLQSHNPLVFITFICNTLGPSFKLQYFYTQDTVMHNPYFNFLLLQPQFKIT